MKKIFYFLSMICWISSFAAGPAFHCNDDLVKIESIIKKLKESDLPFGDKLVMTATQFLGAPEDNYYSVDSLASLRGNIDSFSPLMFINNVVALVKTSDIPGSPNWVSFFDELVDISCRRGENKGFPSLMYHTSDWIGDNVSRGNVSELTENYAGVVARTKSLDEMTRKRNNFAVLADSVTFENVRMTEMGFRTHRVPTLKKETVKKKEVLEDLSNGDIIILVPNRDGIDCYDIGFIQKEEGVPYFIHLSPQTHTVVREKEDLARYMNLMTKHFQGYRILRVIE